MTVTSAQCSHACLYLTRASGWPYEPIMVPQNWDLNKEGEAPQAP